MDEWDAILAVMRRIIRPLTGLLLLVCMSNTACTRRVGFSNQDRKKIVEILEKQDAAWNEGDIEGFMVPYWHSEHLTFSAGGKVTRGWQSTLDRYRKKYPDGAAMGRLFFSDLEILGLGEDHALVLGRWSLDREKPVAGAFSLVMRRDGATWIIIHDHTSSDDAPAPPAPSGP